MFLLLKWFFSLLFCISLSLFLKLSSSSFLLFNYISKALSLLLWVSTLSAISMSCMINSLSAQLLAVSWKRQRMKNSTDSTVKNSITVSDDVVSTTASISESSNLRQDLKIDEKNVNYLSTFLIYSKHLHTLSLLIIELEHQCFSRQVITICWEYFFKHYFRWKLWEWSFLREVRCQIVTYSRVNISKIIQCFCHWIFR